MVLKKNTSESNCSKLGYLNQMDGDKTEKKFIEIKNIICIKSGLESFLFEPLCTLYNHCIKEISKYQGLL